MVYHDIVLYIVQVFKQLTVYGISAARSLSIKYKYVQ